MRRDSIACWIRTNWRDSPCGHVELSLCSSLDELVLVIRVIEEPLSCLGHAPPAGLDGRILPSDSRRSIRQSAIRLCDSPRSLLGLLQHRNLQVHCHWPHPPRSTVVTNMPVAPPSVTVGETILGDVASHDALPALHQPGVWVGQVDATCGALDS